MRAIWLVSPFLVGLLASFVDAQCNPSPCGVNTRCEVSGSGAAICRCLPGFNHLPGQSTIDGCPTRRQEETAPNRFARPQRPRAQRPSNFNNRVQPSIISAGNPCQPSPCGTNAECTVSGNRAVCTCRANTFGDPYTNCQVDPCQDGPCGINAECENTGSRAICKCPPGFNGDPFVRCNDNPCSVDPCGANADCEAQGNRAVCRCREGYEGDPFVQCSLNPCLTSPCGVNAECQESGTRAICKCLDGYEGDPFRSCELNPCFNDPCGPNADCESRGRSAVCKCRPGYVGDPFVNCQLEPCSQDPCGTNAECESQGRSAICKCPRGYSGDPYTNCIKEPCSTNPCGECKNDSECSSSQACFNFKCKDSCQDACGISAQCKAVNHGAICSCPSGYTGDALTACRPQRNPSPQNSRVIGLSRFRRAVSEYLTGFFY